MSVSAEAGRRGGFAASSQHLRLLFGELLVTEYSLVLQCGQLCQLFGAIRGLITVGGDPLHITMKCPVLGARLRGLALVWLAIRQQQRSR